MRPGSEHWAGIDLYLAGVAAAAVLAFGAVGTFAYLAMCLAVGSLAAWSFWSSGFPRLPRLALFLIIAAIALPLAQMIPWPGSMVALLSPARLALGEELWRSLAPSRSWLPLTVDRYATYHGLLKTVCYALVFVMAYQACERTRDRRLLLGALIGIGALEGTYGALQYLNQWHYILWYKKLHNIGFATGTYVGRNQFANLLAMILPLCLARTILQPGGPGAGERGDWKRRLAGGAFDRWGVNIAFLSVMFIGLVFSSGRMGIVSALVGMGVVVTLALVHTRRRRALALLSVLSVGVALSYTMWIGIGGLVAYFGHLEDRAYWEADRITLWRDNARLIADYPWAGTGLGTYMVASRRYQTSRLSADYEHAHSDYMETAAECGVPFAAVLFAGLWLLVLKLGDRAPRLPKAQERAEAIGMAGALSAMLVHALTDFNLQIPANALIFYCMAGAATGVICKQTAEQVRPKTPRLTARDSASGSVQLSP